MITPLSRQQLTKLAKEARELADWTTVRDFAIQMYGEGKAVKVSVDTYGEYNDEGGTNYHVEDVTAYDKDGNVLEFDLSLPFFASYLWEDDKYHDDDTEGMDIFRQYKNIYLWREEDEAKNTFVLCDDLPREDATYDLTAVPALSLFSEQP